MMNDWWWERKRWWLARKLLRWAGVLLARSEWEVIDSQTSYKVKLEPGAPGVQAEFICFQEGRYQYHIGKEDLHGLLIQLAVRDYMLSRKE